jgi:hypothetical protein
MKIFGLQYQAKTLTVTEQLKAAARKQTEMRDLYIARDKLGAQVFNSI